MDINVLGGIVSIKKIKSERQKTKRLPKQMKRTKVSDFLPLSRLIKKPGSTYKNTHASPPNKI